MEINQESEPDHKNVEGIKSKPISKHVYTPSINIGKNIWENITDGITLSWSEVNVWASVQGSKGAICKPKKQRFKQILNDVSGVARPGRLLAILAPSGSGKTTLLNYLSNMLETNLKVKGNLLLNGKNQNVQKSSAYVHQTDLFFELVTVREHLDFHARLRMGKNFTTTQRKERIDKLLNDFDLINQQSILLTSEGTGSKSLSGGEKRRLSIITELLTDPMILFADEPTSGLDSNFAENIVYYLKQLALIGKTIICTIHQPSTSTFSYFDDLVLLSEGYCLYMGPTSNAINHFNQLGYPCPIGYNPADHFIYIVSHIKNKQDEEKILTLETLSRSSKSDIGIEFEDIPITDIQFEKSKLKFNFKYFFGQYKTNPFLQFGLLFKRAIETGVRSPFILATKILQDMILAFIIGLVFLRMPYNTANAINFGAMLFFQVAGLTLNGLIGVIVSFPKELKIYSKENASHLYRSSIYFLAKTFGDMPLQILQILIFNLVVYFLVGLRLGVDIFFWHFLNLSLVYQASISYGYLISALAGNQLISAAMATPMIIPLIVFGGFLIKQSQIPVYLKWVKYISWFSYGFGNAVTLQFANSTVPCTPETCLLINIIPSIPGDLMLLILDINKKEFYMNFFLMLGLIVGYRFIGCLIIILRTNIKNNLHPI